MCGERSGAGRAVQCGAERGGVRGAEPGGAVRCIVRAEMQRVRCRPGAGVPVLPEFLTPQSQPQPEVRRGLERLQE